MSSIGLCRNDDRATILAIVNAAAEAYRGVIPPETSVVLASPPLGEA